MGKDYRDVLINRYNKSKDAGDNDYENPELIKQHENMWGKTGEAIVYINVDFIDFFKKKNGKTQKIQKTVVKGLRKSFSEIGQKTPIVVRPVGDKYEVISGHHRLTAARELGWELIKCVVRNYTYEEACKEYLDSNIHRRLYPTELGEQCSGYYENREDLDLTVNDIAEKFNIGRATVYRYIDVVNCIAPIQQLFDDGIINIDCATIIVNVGEEKQKEIVSLFETGKIKKMTASTLKKFLNGEIDKPIEKPCYKNKVYQNVFNQMPEKFEDVSETELDAIVEELLTEYFSKK